MRQPFVRWVWPLEVDAVPLRYQSAKKSGSSHVRTAMHWTLDTLPAVALFRVSSPPVFCPCVLSLRECLGLTGASRLFAVQDALVTACSNGDLDAVKAALAGAGLNVKGSNRRGGQCTPLTAAVCGKHHAVVSYLLLLGADPNGDAVMWTSVSESTPDILRLVIEAGGDVNRASYGDLPIFAALATERCDEATERLRVLLSHPELDLSITDAAGHSPVEAAVAGRREEWADLIRDEVRVRVRCSVDDCVCVCVCVAPVSPVLFVLCWSRSHDDSPWCVTNRGKQAARVVSVCVRGCRARCRGARICVCRSSDEQRWTVLQSVLGYVQMEGTTADGMLSEYHGLPFACFMSQRALNVCRLLPRWWRQRMKRITQW